MTPSPSSPEPPVGLYLHVPFCRFLCTYCAFAKEEYESSRAEAWLLGIVREIEYRAQHTWSDRPQLDSVFLGGGTPTALTLAQWEKLGELLHQGFHIPPDAEFTSEANPESFNAELGEVMRKVGVNRLSFGVQSSHQNELKLLGRAHGWDEVERAVSVARSIGFDNINLDLMYGLPEQKPAQFEGSLARVLSLTPDHVSAYCLGLEPGTVLHRWVEEGAEPQPEEEASRTMFETLVAGMRQSGRAPYELSNFALPNRACRHNLKYWRRQDYLALGPSAHGLYQNQRWANPAPLEKWIQAYEGGANSKPPLLRAVPKKDACFEWVFLNLRLTNGFALENFEREWKEPFDSVYGEVASKLQASGHLHRDDGRLRLTESAWFVSDAVFSEFVPQKSTS